MMVINRSDSSGESNTREQNNKRGFLKKILKKIDNFWLLLAVNWPVFIMLAPATLIIIFIIYVAATGGFY